MGIQAVQVYELGVNATRNATIDFTDELDDGELLTGTPTVVEIATTDLTIASVARNVAAETIWPDGPDQPSRIVAIDKGVQFRVSGAVAGTAYQCAVSVTTDGGQTLTGTVRLRGVADA